jgi:hypothetical protein
MSNNKITASTRRYAEGYIKRGLAVVPIPDRLKRPQFLPGRHCASVLMS